IVGHDVRGGADDLNAALVGLVIRLSTDKSRQEGMGNIDHPVWVARHKFRRENAHVFGEDDVFGRITSQHIRDQIFMLVSLEILMADIVKWDVELFNTSFKFLMVANNGGGCGRN